MCDSCLKRAVSPMRAAVSVRRGVFLNHILKNQLPSFFSSFFPFAADPESPCREFLSVSVNTPTARRVCVFVAPSF